LFILYRRVRRKLWPAAALFNSLHSELSYDWGMFISFASCVFFSIQ
jgi:hypothetical protein